MHKKYRVTLTRAEREELERLLARGKADVRKIRRDLQTARGRNQRAAADTAGSDGAL